MSNSNNITLSNRLLVPDELVPTNLLKSWYYEWERFYYEPELDEFGEIRLDTFNKPIMKRCSEECTLRTYREFITYDGRAFYSLPRGNMDKLRVLLNYDYRDLRPVPPLGYPLQINEETQTDRRWPDQKRCVDEYLRKGFGIVEGDTGSGKTVIGIGICCRLGLTTLIISPQRDGIEQWSGAFRKHTNLPELTDEMIGGYSSRVKKWYPITISTVQAFLSPKGKRWLQKYRSSFGLVIVDEVHSFAAPEYSKVINALNPLTLLGLTATAEREDKRHHVVFDCVGPVVASGKARQMPPTVYFIDTGIKAPDWIYQQDFPNHYRWNEILKTLAESEERYDIICKYLRKDLDNGRTIICIAQRRAIVRQLYERMSQDGYDIDYVDGTTPKGVRKEIYRKINDGELQAVFAGKVLNQLVDLPRVDCLHFASPLSKKSATKQIYGRSRRWVEGKKNPIIRDYVDQGGQLDGAYKNRMALSKSHGWTVKRINVADTQTLGTSIWSKYRG